MCTIKLLWFVSLQMDNKVVDASVPRFSMLMHALGRRQIATDKYVHMYFVGLVTRADAVL